MSKTYHPLDNLAALVRAIGKARHEVLQAGKDLITQQMAAFEAVRDDRMDELAEIEIEICAARVRYAAKMSNLSDLLAREKRLHSRLVDVAILLTGEGDE